jgi:hypothetical protein
LDDGRRSLISSALSVVKAVFPVDDQWINARKQPAFCLSQVQVDRSVLTTGDQQPSDIVHMRSWLMVWLKLF